MARIIEQFHVARPSDEVFRAIADFATAAQWDPGVAAAEQVEGDRPGSGAAFRLLLAMGPTRLPFTYVTEVYEPDERVGKKAVAGLERWLGQGGRGRSGRDETGTA